MKKIINLLAIIIAFSFHSVLLGQTTSKDILKATYVSDNLTPSMLSILKAQVPSEDKLQDVIDKISKYKSYYTLYVNMKTNESLFILDSISKAPGVAVAGHTEYLYIDREGNISGSENFMKEQLQFNGSLSDIKWVLSDETKEINGHTCYKASVEQYPYITAWYANDISINRGPSYLIGLIGLVFEGSDYFVNFKLSSLDYYESIPHFNTIITEYKNKDSHKNTPIGKLLKSKDNMIATMRK